MKVIQGNFGEKELPEHVGERLRGQIEESGILDIEHGDYTLIFDRGDALYIISSGEGPGDVLLSLEKGKVAILANAFGGGEKV